MSEKQSDAKNEYQAIVMDFLGRLESGDRTKLRELQLVSEKLMRTMKLYQLEAKDSWEGLKYMLERLKGEDICELDDSYLSLLGKRISGYLNGILEKVPQKERDDLYEVLARVLLYYSPTEIPGRQGEHQSLPRAQSKSQQSSVLTYEEFIKILKEECSDRKVAERLIGKEIYFPNGRAYGIKGKIESYEINPRNGKVRISVRAETAWGARAEFTLEELEKYLKEIGGESNRSYLT